MPSSSHSIAKAVKRRHSAGGLAGKLLFDDVRQRFAEFESEEESLYRQRSRGANWLQTTNVLVSILGLVTIPM